MPTSLKYVDPNRPRTGSAASIAAFSRTRLGRFISARRLEGRSISVAGNPRPSRDGLSSSPPPYSKPGARRAATVRRNAVIYFHDGDRVTIVASKAGDARHPAWFHNLRANPDVTFGGIPMRAAVVTDEAERRRLWTLADRVFAPYAAYRRDAAKGNRTIPIVQLTAREPGAVA